jgi:hypothetical protein
MLGLGSFAGGVCACLSHKPDSAALLEHMRLEPAGEFIARHDADAVLSTDDRLVAEYRHGRRFGPHFPQALNPGEPQG